MGGSNDVGVDQFVECDPLTECNGLGLSPWFPDITSTTIKNCAKRVDLLVEASQSDRRKNNLGERTIFE
jgi:hypothetical protein